MFDCALEADEPANQSVVARVRGVGVGLPEVLIEPLFGKREGVVGNYDSRSAQARLSDGHQENLRGLDACAQVLKPSTDEITPWKRAVVHRQQYIRPLADVPGDDTAGPGRP